jgi:hypothetical protein
MEAKIYLDAMKVDILKILEQPDLGVFELRKMEKIGRLMADFVGGLGTFSEQNGFGAAMRDSETIAPTLHQALMSRTFDGEVAFKDLYAGLLEQYAQLKGAAVEVDTMRQRLTDGMGNARHAVLAAELGLPRLDEQLEKVQRQIGSGSGDEDDVDPGAAAGLLAADISDAELAEDNDEQEDEEKP